ncbi:glycosyltransferase [Flavobacteriaceae bacterium]|nr:glycosyltransferase [Flavobacteriaceae bacterium]
MSNYRFNFNQTYRKIELIIVDDGSTDNTTEVIHCYNDNRIRYFKTNNWGSPAKPRNIGIAKAKGEVIAFCDDDDIWIENKLSIQIRKMEESNCDFVYSNMYHFNTNINILQNKKSLMLIKSTKSKIL